MRDQCEGGASEGSLIVSEGNAPRTRVKVGLDGEWTGSGRRVDGGAAAKGGGAGGGESERERALRGESYPAAEGNVCAGTAATAIE